MPGAGTWALSCPPSYLSAVDDGLTVTGHQVAGGRLPRQLVVRLITEANRFAEGQQGWRTDVTDLPGKDGCGLLRVVPGLDRKSAVAFDTARSAELADLVTGLIGPGWVPFRSQLIMPSAIASLEQWHQDQRVFSDHFDDEIAITIAIPLQPSTVPLQFAAIQPRVGFLLNHHQLQDGPLAFEASTLSGTPPILPAWIPGVPIAFHAFTVHRWMAAIQSSVYLFSYRSSRHRRYS